MHDSLRRGLDDLRRLGASRLAVSGVGLLLAMALVTLVLLFSGFDVANGYRALLQGAFGSKIAIADVLARATPLIFAGLAVALPFRAGLFNVGAEGQLLLGALGAAVVGQMIGLPPPVHLVLILLGSAAIGALWGLIPALLKTHYGAHEVITTIMLNYVAILLIGYLVNYPLHPAEELSPATGPIVSSAELPQLIAGSQLTPGILLAALGAILSYVLLKWIPTGYEIRAVGLNAQAAEAAGILRGTVWMKAMALGGALAGIGGAVEVLGVHRRYIEGFSPGYGFDGIAVALIAYSDPLAVLPAALALGAIRAGALNMDRTTDIPSDFILVVQGIMLLFLALPGAISIARNRLRAARALSSSREGP